MKTRNLLLAIVLITAGTTYAQIPTNGLVSYWPFNGNANDESGNGHNPIENTATLTTDRFGNPNSAYYFDGSLGSYIMIPDHDSLDPLNDYTFTFWINPASYASIGGQILNKYRAYVNDEGGWAAQLDPTHLGISPCFWSQSVVQLNTWTFGAIAFKKSTNTCSIYLNGALDNSGTNTALIRNNARNLYIGIHEGVSYGNFDGKIDDIRMYNRTLTEREISAIYTEGKCFEIIYDTVHIQVFDTVTVYKEISVIDTLIIDVLLTGDQPTDDINTLKVYPNPANDILTIHTGNFAEMADYSIKIVNQLGTTVFETPVTQPSYEINLSTWTAKGVYVLQIYDNNNEIKAVKKIILQ